MASYAVSARKYCQPNQITFQGVHHSQVCTIWHAFEHMLLALAAAEAFNDYTSSRQDCAARHCSGAHLVSKQQCGSAKRTPELFIHDVLQLLKLGTPAGQADAAGFWGLIWCSAAI